MWPGLFKEFIPLYKYRWAMTVFQVHNRKGGQNEK